MKPQEIYVETVLGEIHEEPAYFSIEVVFAILFKDQWYYQAVKHYFVDSHPDCIILN